MHGRYALLVVLGGAGGGRHRQRVGVAHATTTVKTMTSPRRSSTSPSRPAGGLGPVQYVIKNTGKVGPRLAISGPGLKTKRTALIKPGKSATLAVTLREQDLRRWSPCPVMRHRA